MGGKILGLALKSETKSLYLERRIVLEISRAGVVHDHL
jgi:hypothetical protein